MKLKGRTSAIIISELVMFVFILAVIGLDEFLDMPHFLFGAIPKPSRMEEFIIEAGSVTIVAILVIAGTVLQLRRIERIERFLRVCAWCKKVWAGDRWVVFEEYIKKEHMLKSSHGICPECAEKLKAETRGESDEKRKF